MYPRRKIRNNSPVLVIPPFDNSSLFRISSFDVSKLQAAASLLLGLTLFASASFAQNVTVAGSTGANATYATLKAAFDALNANTNQTGNTITVSIVGNTTETASAVLNQPSGGSWSTLTISPSGTRSITGAIAGHLIDLNGADNVTISGWRHADD